MSHPHVNSTIHCDVNSCVHHDRKNYCTLNEIRVGCCDCLPTSCRGTECASFQADASQVK